MLDPSLLYICNTCVKEFDGNSINYCTRCGTTNCLECMPTGISAGVKSVLVRTAVCHECSDSTAIKQTKLADYPEAEGTEFSGPFVARNFGEDDGEY